MNIAVGINVYAVVSTVHENNGQQIRSLSGVFTVWDIHVGNRNVASVISQIICRFLSLDLGPSLDAILAVTEAKKKKNQNSGKTEGALMELKRDVQLPVHWETYRHKEMNKKAL